MYGIKTKEETESREFYRCPVDSDKSAAKIKVGRRFVRASVIEKSIDCYSVVVTKSVARKMIEGKHYRMSFDGTVVEVQVQQKSEQDKGVTQIGLLQVRDLTRPPAVKKSWWSSRNSTSTVSNNATVAFGGFVLVLFCAMALPGLGDRLGTSDRIQNAVRWCISSVNVSFDRWL